MVVKKSSAAKKSDDANKIPVEKFAGKKIGGEKTAHQGKQDKVFAPFGGSGKKKGTKKGTKKSKK
jgi:hypothetical protein